MTIGILFFKEQVQLKAEKTPTPKAWIKFMLFTTYLQLQRIISCKYTIANKSKCVNAKCTYLCISIITLLRHLLILKIDRSFALSVLYFTLISKEFEEIHSHLINELEEDRLNYNMLNFIITICTNNNNIMSMNIHAS